MCKQASNVARLALVSSIQHMHVTYKDITHICMFQVFLSFFFFSLLFRSAFVSIQCERASKKKTEKKQAAAVAAAKATIPNHFDNTNGILLYTYIRRVTV